MSRSSHVSRRQGRGRHASRPLVRAAGFVIAFALLAGPAGSAGARGAAVPDHSDFDALLAKYASHAGVRYAAWHADAEDRAALRAYVARMQTVNIAAISDEPDGRKAQLAFWLNLYNAATLDMVLARYPVKSIKDLGEGDRGPWDREVVTVDGKKLSLNAIENDIIRPAFAEPRIHFALNCAAKSCPPLRAGAYTAERLPMQLDEQTKAFLADKRFTRFDDKTLTLSKVFDWYAKDFEAAAGSVLAWVRPYLPVLSVVPVTMEIHVKYAEYDWSLNEVR